MLIIGDKTLDKVMGLISSDKLRMVWYSIPEDEANKSDGFTKSWAWVITPELFTTREIEHLRELDEHSHPHNCARMIANFLPDGIRPDDVPPL